MSNPDLMYDEAIALKDKGDLPAAVEKLLEIESIEPTHSLTHSALAIMLQKLGRFDEAITHAKKVVELNPNDSFSQSQLSVIYQRCGRIPEAEDALARSRTMSAHGGGWRKWRLRPSLNRRSSILGLRWKNYPAN